MFLFHVVVVVVVVVVVAAAAAPAAATVRYIANDVEKGTLPLYQS